MLTRLEVDGFKNLLGFAADFGPFTCIAGPNGVGKSNLFDAIRFLSLLADHNLVMAGSLVRQVGGDTSDLQDLFWRNSSGATQRFRIAAEMLVDRNVTDDFGRPAAATSTFLRYEVEIGYDGPPQRTVGERLTLLSEQLHYFTEGKAARRLKFPHSRARFREAAVVNERHSPAGYISVRTAEDGQTEIHIHGDGGSRGPGQVAPAAQARATIVGTSNTSGTPTILAARREMQRWHFLALEPSAMRQPDRFQADPTLSPHGAHLPAVLYRLAAGASGDDSEAVYARTANRLAALVPVVGLRVDVDQVRRLLTLVVEEQGGVRLPASSLSDGTLRFLALAVLAADPEATGLYCIEEPENGIHPARLTEMVHLLRDLAVNPDEKPDADNPFRQVIVATHSPAFVQLQRPDDLLFAVETLSRDSGGRPMRTLRCRPVENTWRARSGVPAVGGTTILDYLGNPPCSQLTLPDLV